MRAYDPTLGRFLSRDPLGRVPLLGWADQPYVYAGNNSLVNVDPSGQRFVTESAAQAKAAVNYHKQKAARVQARRGNDRGGAHSHDGPSGRTHAAGITGPLMPILGPSPTQIANAIHDLDIAALAFQHAMTTLTVLGIGLGIATILNPESVKLKTLTTMVGTMDADAAILFDEFSSEEKNQDWSPQQLRTFNAIVVATLIAAVAIPVGVAIALLDADEDDPTLTVESVQAGLVAGAIGNWVLFTATAKGAIDQAWRDLGFIGVP